MHSAAFNISAALTPQNISHLRLTGMVMVLVGGLLSGYLAGNKLHISERWARKIMTVVLLFFNAPIAVMVIWRMRLTAELIWLPVIGLALMLTVAAISTGLFSFFALERTSRLTLILAAALSNLGYTGGAFVCYVLFGCEGLAMANLYLVLWLPTVYLVFFPLLKMHDLRPDRAGNALTVKSLLDYRMLPFPGVITAIILNLTDVGYPQFIWRLHIVDILVFTASSLAFFSIGLRVKLYRLRKFFSLYLPLAAVKFVLTPVVAFLLIQLLGLAGQSLTIGVRNVIMVLSVTPSAVLMVTMSNVFDLDGPLASALWLVTNAGFAAVVVPVLYFIFA